MKRKKKRKGTVEFGYIDCSKSFGDEFDFPKDSLWERLDDWWTFCIDKRKLRKFIYIRFRFFFYIMFIPVIAWQNMAHILIFFGISLSFVIVDVLIAFILNDSI